MFGVSTYSEFPFVNIANQYTSTLSETTTLSADQTSLAIFVGIVNELQTLIDVQTSLAAFLASQSEFITLVDYQIERGWFKANNTQTVTWENDFLQAVTWVNVNGAIVYWTPPLLIWHQIDDNQ